MEILLERGWIFVWSLKAAKSNRPIMAQNMPTILWPNPLTTSFNTRWIRLYTLYMNWQYNFGTLFCFCILVYSQKQLIHQSIFQRFFCTRRSCCFYKARCLALKLLRKFWKFSYREEHVFFLFASKTWFNCLTWIFVVWIFRAWVLKKLDYLVVINKNSTWKDLFQDVLSCQVQMWPFWDGEWVHFRPFRKGDLRQ